MFGLAINAPEAVTFVTGLSFDGRGSYVLHAVTTAGQGRSFTAGGGGPAGSVQSLANGGAFLDVISPCGKRWTLQVNPSTKAVQITAQGGKAVSLPASRMKAMMDAVTTAAEARVAIRCIADQLAQDPAIASQAGMLGKMADTPDDGMMMTIWTRYLPALREMTGVS